MTQPEIKVGQIWREVDSRFCRHVRVEDASSRDISIRTVTPDGTGRWVEGVRSRISYASPLRFNGKRGNYELVEEAR